MVQTKSLIMYYGYLFVYNKMSPFSNIWEVILGPGPFKNIDLRVKILKNDKVDIL